MRTSLLLTVFVVGCTSVVTPVVPTPTPAPPTKVATAPAAEPTRCEVLFEILCTRVEGCIGNRTDCRDIVAACPSIDPFVDAEEFEACAQAMVRAPCSEFSGTLPEACQGIGSPQKPRPAPGQRDL